MVYLGIKLITVGRNRLKLENRRQFRNCSIKIHQAWLLKILFNFLKEIKCLKKRNTRRSEKYLVNKKKRQVFGKFLFISQQTQIQLFWSVSKNTFTEVLQSWSSANFCSTMNDVFMFSIKKKNVVPSQIWKTLPMWQQYASLFNQLRLSYSGGCHGWISLLSSLIGSIIRRRIIAIIRNSRHLWAFFVIFPKQWLWSPTYESLETVAVTFQTDSTVRAFF